MPFPSILLTLDTDDRRINSNSNIIEDYSGRKIAIYEKLFTSGRSTGGIVTFTSSSFNIHIQTGTGMINSIPVSWSDLDTVVTPNSFSLVYVNDSGDINVTASFSMSVIKDAIVLAYIFSGSSSIVSVEVVETSGNYIYVRKQILSGGNWIWDDSEYVLNTGEQPKIFYDQSNLIYMSYKKDGVIFGRVFDLTNDALTWTYIPNVYIQNGNEIHLKSNPQNVMYGLGSSANEANAFVTSIDLFPLGPTAFVFMESVIPGIFGRYIYLPFVIGSNLQYLYYPYWIEVFSYNGSYTLEASYVVYDNTNPLIRWREWIEPPKTNGKKYIGLRANHGYYKNQYVTDPANYLSLEIFDPFEFHEIISGNISSQLVERDYRGKGSSAYESQYTKTSEYDSTKDFEEDHSNNKGSSAYEAVCIKPLEFDSKSDFKEDHFIGSGSSGHEAIMIIT